MSNHQLINKPKMFSHFKLKMGRLGIASFAYSIWQRKLELREELWQFLADNRPEQGAGHGAAVGARVRMWDTGNQNARATVGLLLEDSQLNLIRGIKTARDTWESFRR